MKIKLFTAFFMLTFLCFTKGSGQAFTWSRTLKPEKSAGWHKFALPPEMAAKVQPGYRDVRIMAIDKKGDTTEVPYFLDYPKPISEKPQMAFNILNKTTREGLFYYTLEQPGKIESLNEIELGFSKKNFDLKVTLEGSQRQEEWFTILRDYRITAIQNNQADFHYTTLTLPMSGYKYYRLSYAAPDDPALLTAHSMVSVKPDESAFWVYPRSNYRIDIQNTEKETVCSIEGPGPMPVSVIRVHVADSIQYIRPVTILGIPFQSSGGLKKENPFITLATATLNSFEHQPIEIPATLTGSLKLIIHNADNPPLKVDSITLESYRQQVITRLPEAEKFLLLYGSRQAHAPQYDLKEVFEKLTLPEPAKMETGPEIRNLPEKPKSWWENNAWLYVLMGLMVLILGGFTLKMMKKAPHTDGN